MGGSFTIGIDLGGTNIKAGLIDPAGGFAGRWSIETQAYGGYRHVLGRIAELVERIAGESPGGRAGIQGIGIGVPGPMSHKQGLIYGAPNLPGWVNVPVRDDLRALVTMPVTLENDANAAAYGEFVAGAGRDKADIVFLTLGTGIGGGIIADGRLHRGFFDNAGEAGHMIIVPRGRACPCGQHGCLERYSSANAVAERLVEAVEAGEKSLLADKIRRGVAINSKDVADARRGGCSTAGRVWDEACLYLAIACVNLQHLLNPEQIVLGGGLINAGAELLDPVRKHFDELTWRVSKDYPTIDFATLGGDAGVIGAAALARIGAGAA